MVRAFFVTKLCGILSKDRIKYLYKRAKEKSPHGICGLNRSTDGIQNNIEQMDGVKL